MTQKVAWKAKKTRCGIVVPSRGSKVTSCSPTWPRPPIRSPVPSKASEYPTSAQVIVTTASAAMHIMKVLSAFFERTRPA